MSRRRPRRAACPHRAGPRASLVALAALSLSCQSPGSSGAHRRGQVVAPSTADLRGITLVDLEVSPQGEPASHYGADATHALAAAEADIAEALAPLPMTHAPALSKMTRELARLAPDQVNVPSTLVDGLMAWAGLVEPPPRLVVVEIAEDRIGCHRRIAAGCRDALASLVQQVRTTLPDAEPLEFGVGVVSLPGGRTRMMVSILERSIELSPIPTAVGAGSSVALEGRLLGPRERPVVEVVDPAGNWGPVPAAVASDGSFRSTVQCRRRGPHQVEVLAEGPHGPEVAANFPLWCGARPAKSISMSIERVDPEVTADQIARANFVYLNEERERRGLPPLSWDPAAADVALGHSEDMQASGFVGHRSPTTGDVTARFVRAKLSGTVIRENVARGYGPRGIHDSLMRSPGHRVNMLATDVTHVGIGAVLGPAETNVPGAPRPVFATQNFYRKAGAGAPERERDLAPALADRVDAARAQAGVPPAVWDAKLDKIAQKRADAHAAGRNPPDGFEKEVFALGYKAVESHKISSPDFEALATVDLFLQPKMAAGLGVVRAHDATGIEVFVAVVLVAER
jgi:uncharacterized protein YkwD